MAPRPPLERAYLEKTLRSHKTLEKKTVNRDFSTFSHPLIFFLLTVSCLTLSLSLFCLFSSLTALTTVAASVHKSEVRLRNFLR